MNENKPNRYNAISKKLSDSELEYRLENPDHFQHLAVLAARNELLRRGRDGLPPEPELKQEEKYTQEELEELRMFEELVNGTSASFTNRFFAHIIDSLICIISFSVVYILLIVFEMSYINTWLLDKSTIQLLFFLTYYVFWESSDFQATLGKRLFKLKVVDQHGNKLDAGRAIIRYFSKILSVLTFFIGYIMLFFDLKKRTLHDRISKTHVIKHFESNLRNDNNTVILDENF